MPSPAFCWTRFGVEAGQNIAAIFARKELERRNNNGVFLWGIGNSVLPSMPLLLDASHQPKVVFSPIRSRPRDLDVAPGAVAVWTRARTFGNKAWSLPASSLVTSHAGRAVGRHYALVCRSDYPLTPSDDGPAFRMSELTNLRTDRPVGPSQVTAIVRHRPQKSSFGLEYQAAMIIDLVAPYVVALEAPIIVPINGLSEDGALGAAWAVRYNSHQKESDVDLSDNMSERQYELFG